MESFLINCEIVKTVMQTETHLQIEVVSLEACKLQCKGTTFTLMVSVSGLHHTLNGFTAT